MEITVCVYLEVNNNFMFKRLSFIPSISNFGDFAELSLFYGFMQFEFSEAFYGSLIKNNINPQEFAEFTNENRFDTFYRSAGFTIETNPSSNIVLIVNDAYYKYGQDFFTDRCFRQKLLGSASESFWKRSQIKVVEDYSLLNLFEEFQNKKALIYVALILKTKVEYLEKNLKIAFEGDKITIKVKGVNFNSVVIALRKYIKSHMQAMDCSWVGGDFMAKDDENYFSYSLNALNNQVKIAEFKDFALQGIPSVAEIIDTGRRSLKIM